MSASPVTPNFPSHISRSPAWHRAWIPVLFGMAVICFESTRVMGGNTTIHWLAAIWPKSLGQINAPLFILVHHVLRKTGHFTGYGTLGLLLRRAWQQSIRVSLNMLGSQLMLAASALAVSCTFLVGSLDEWHQSVTPGRSSTFTDVLIDTCGALMFNLIFFAISSYRRSSVRR
jgi:VanZ family protein